MCLTRSGLSKLGVFFLVINFLEFIFKARPNKSFSTLPINSLQHWSWLFFCGTFYAFTSFFISFCSFPVFPFTFYQSPVVLLYVGLAFGGHGIRERCIPLSFFPIRSFGLEEASLFFSLDRVTGVHPRDAKAAFCARAILIMAVCNSSLFWILIPLSTKHLWGQRSLPKISAAVPTLDLTAAGLFLDDFRGLAQFFHFLTLFP